MFALAHALLAQTYLMISHSRDAWRQAMFVRHLVPESDGQITNTVNKT